jgi:hypothetical protein
MQHPLIATLALSVAAVQAVAAPVCDNTKLDQIKKAVVAADAIAADICEAIGSSAECVTASAQVVKMAEANKAILVICTLPKVLLTNKGSVQK